MNNQYELIIANFKFSALEQVNALNSELNQIESQLNQLTISKQNHKITSPVSGSIQQLNISTIGAVVGVAEALMVIVPEDTLLITEAIILNKDIGQVQKNQKVEIKIDAFDFKRFGSLQGTIKSISQDANELDQGQLGYYALIEIDLKSNPLVYSKINPGMSLMAEIDTGQRRVIEFFLSKMIKYQDESLSER